MVDMCPISFYLGLKVDQNCDNQTIKLFQPAYIDKILNKFHLDKTNTINTLIKRIILFQAKTDSVATAGEKERYQGIIGSIMFSMIQTRLNIFFTTSVVSNFAKNPGHNHTKALTLSCNTLESG